MNILLWWTASYWNWSLEETKLKSIGLAMVHPLQSISCLEFVLHGIRSSFECRPVDRRSIKITSYSLFRHCKGIWFLIGGWRGLSIGFYANSLPNEWRSLLSIWLQQQQHNMEERKQEEWYRQTDKLVRVGNSCAGSSRNSLPLLFCSYGISFMADDIRRRIRRRT